MDMIRRLFMEQPHGRSMMLCSTVLAKNICALTTKEVVGDDVSGIGHIRSEARCSSCHRSAADLARGAFHFHVLPVNVRQSTGRVNGGN